MVFSKNKHTVLSNGVRAPQQLHPSVKHPASVHSDGWKREKEEERKKLGKFFSCIIFGKITVLFMRKVWGTTVQCQLYSTTAFRVVGAYGSSGISFKALEDNVKFSMALRQLASLLVSSFQHHRKNISFPFSSSFSHTHVSHPYLCSPQCIKSNIRLHNKQFS